MQFSKYLLDGSTLNSKYLTVENIQSVEKFYSQKKLAMIEYGIRTVGKTCLFENFAKGG